MTTVLKHPDITRARIGRLRGHVERVVEGRSVAFDVAAWRVPGEPVPAAVGLAADYEPFEIGSPWGPPWTTTWFRLRGHVPADMAGRRLVAAVDMTGGGDTGFTGEGLVYRYGRVVQGISPHHRHVLLSESATPGEEIELFIEAAANPSLGYHHPALLARADQSGAPLFVLHRADLTTIDPCADSLNHDLRVLTQLLGALPNEDPRAARLLLALNDACNALDPRDVPGTLATVRNAIAGALAAPAPETAHTVLAVGHAHIDSAWLWPVRETRRKCQRTFSTAVALMDRYPEYHFVCSQPVQYEWVKEDQPELFERIREKIATGQWEPVGSMYVEADCNLAGAESLVRQLLYGKRFFERELGVDTTDVWLPDVFGYAANLPQLFRKAGVDFFLTQKLSWNQFNKLPHQTFWWEGIDGSRVLTHFPPADTYNGNFDAKQVVDSARKHRDHGRSDLSLYLFGWGDGGGGPTSEMIESARRLRSLEGAPRVEMATITGAAQRMRDESRDLATWVGELYFEYHRGTYTSQARTKLLNRRCEVALRDAEMLTVAAGVDDAESRDVLTRSWKTVLLNQFHDIIPGSSINWVYEVAEREYAQVLAEVGALTARCLDRIAAGLATGASEAPVLVVNTGAGPRRTVATLPLAGATDAVATVARSGGRTQVVERGGERSLLLALELGQHGPTVVDVDALAGAAAPALRVEDRLLENDLLTVHFDEEGLITSIVDRRAGREVLTEGARANLLQLHEDRPLSFDAWDVDIYYRETHEDVTALDGHEVVDRGPVRATIRQVRRVGETTITQWISLDARSPVLRFETEVDWHEDQRLLKVAFPVDVRAPQATYEVQFGTVQRPTHFNTSWDMARFEVCGHRWADLSDGRYGVALMNDSKYGYDIHGGTMRLSLLRAPIFPDPVADRGVQRFTYALLPHQGDWRTAGVVEAAQDLNNPVLLRALTPSADGAVTTAPWFEVDAPGLVLETVKWAEDDGSVIVRLYEAHGGRVRGAVRTRLPIAAAQETDLLERPQRDLPVAGGCIEVEAGPYEVVTLRVVPASG